ncbi:MAG: hypothetical protein R2799_07120 [Crocinitomicaceae bacterium]
MELFDENIEQLILDKEYHQLTEGEKEGIKDFISNEEEYAQFKMTLMMSSDLKTERIQPKESTKASLMQMMEGSRPEKKIWYNGIGVFFFPEDKPTYAKPGIYASLAAILLLVFFFVPMDFGTVNENKGNVAQAEDNMAKESADESTIATEEEMMEKDIPLTPAESNKNAEIEAKEGLLEDLDHNDGKIFANQNEPAMLEEVADELDGNAGYLKQDLEYGADDKKKTAADDRTITLDYIAGGYPNGGGNSVVADSLNSRVVAPGNNERRNEKGVAFKENQNNFISGDLKKDGFTYEILNDNGLNQNTDLIDLLYTAD